GSPSHFAYIAIDGEYFAHLPGDRPHFARLAGNPARFRHTTLAPSPFAHTALGSSDASRREHRPLRTAGDPRVERDPCGRSDPDPQRVLRSHARALSGVQPAL